MRFYNFTDDRHFAHFECTSSSKLKKSVFSLHPTVRPVQNASRSYYRSKTDKGQRQSFMIPLLPIWDASIEFSRHTSSPERCSKLGLKPNWIGLLALIFWEDRERLPMNFLESIRVYRMEVGLLMFKPTKMFWKYFEYINIQTLVTTFIDAIYEKNCTTNGRTHVLFCCTIVSFCLLTFSQFFPFQFNVNFVLESSQDSMYMLQCTCCQCTCYVNVNVNVQLHFLIGS